MYDQNVEEQGCGKVLDGLIPWVWERKEGINVLYSLSLSLCDF